MCVQNGSLWEKIMTEYGIISLALTLLSQPALFCYGRIITLGVLVPQDGSRSMGDEAEAAVQLAITKVSYLTVNSEAEFSGHYYELTVRIGINFENKSYSHKTENS